MRRIQPGDSRWKWAVAVAAMVLMPFALPAEETPRMEERDRVRIAEVFRLADAVQERVWPGWSRALFAVLLVTPETEFLVRHPNPPTDFALVGEDPALGGAVFARKRQFQTRFLATFPVNGINTVVVGQAENTQAETSTNWVVTLMHEHFHQWQYSQPGYFNAVNLLGLAHGDTTGMWMLNYAYPYEKATVQERYDTLRARLGEALSAGDEKDLRAKFEAYRSARRAIASAVSPDDDRYFAFQLWQEGVARYTEIRVAEIAAREYKPSEAFAKLPDYTPFGAAAREVRARTAKELASLRLGESKRETLYSVGASLALLLDRVAPKWHSRYFSEKFDLDRYAEPPADAAPKTTEK